MGQCCCGHKLPLWLGLLLLLAVVGLLVPLIYFAVRANSKACVDGLQAQKECQEHNRHLQRQLDQASGEKEAEAATCNRSVVSHCTPSPGRVLERLSQGLCGDPEGP